MVIKKKHAEVLERLLKDEEQELPFTPLEVVDEPTARELELMGLLRFASPVRLVPTYWGKELALLLRELYALGPKPHGEEEEEVGGDIVVREAWGLRPPAEWDEGFRFLGSEVIALLEAAERAGRVGPEGVEPLMSRGLAARVWDRERKREDVALTDQGKRALEIYRALKPGLEVDASLAEVIRKLPMGPAESARLSLPEHEEHLLEAMRLTAYSVPNTEIFAFTALGQAVKRALVLGGYGEGDVLTEDLLLALADYVDTGQATLAGLATLQALGYVGPEGELLPAGEWALEAFRLFRDKPEGEALTFDVDEEEMAILRAVQALWEKARTNPEERPTFENLRREMVDRKVKEYKALLEKYGRKLEELPKKRQEIARRFQEAKDFLRWYEENFNLRAYLHSLEGLQLLRSVEDEKGKEVFDLTPFGAQVLEDGAERVSADAVKAITTTRKRFAAPNLSWYHAAREEGLLGSGEPSRRGYLYADLAEKVERLPFLTTYEHLVFRTIGQKGITLPELYQVLEARIEREQVTFALGKLEARRLVEVLPDGNVVETEAGILMDQALSAVHEGVGFPVTPHLVRLLRALREVGTLYVKEQRVRILPRNLAEARRRSGLSEEAFADALELARALGFVGQNSLNSAGLALLEAVEKMNTKVADRYVEVAY
ncbi:DUF505 domain-containing protein [Thermus scotoductus]|uniref:DUF505 domain-containing protein n=3 Tax=Bacteria TaxID=2 RepID=UPI002430E66E|nr:DUF505 domain-containing protein [Thermus scotoductus]